MRNVYVHKDAENMDVPKKRGRPQSLTDSTRKKKRLQANQTHAKSRIFITGTVCVTRLDWNQTPNLRDFSSTLTMSPSKYDLFSSSKIEFLDIILFICIVYYGNIVTLDTY